MIRPLAVHLEPYHRDAFMAGDLVAVDEVQIVVVQGPWDHETQAFATHLVTRGKEVYLYLQFFTSPLIEWRNAEPSLTLGGLPTIPHVQAWAFGRDAIDWPRTRLPLGLEALLPPGVGVFVDNYFPELEPWMFRADSWTRVPGLGAMKRQSYSRMARAFTSSFNGVTILNGRPDPSERCQWIMVERAAARKAEAEQIAARHHALLSVPAEETYNITWLLERWKDGNAISFTSDSADGIASAASIYAYALAVQYRRNLDPDNTTVIESGRLE